MMVRERFMTDLQAVRSAARTPSFESSRRKLVFLGVGSARTVFPESVRKKVRQNFRVLIASAGAR